MTLVVRDTGAGMSPEVRARATEMFFTTKTRGSGIGLALAAGVAEAVGGALEIESQLGRGTSITVTFPINGRRPE
jgi:signal transduction histidine kinase